MRDTSVLGFSPLEAGLIMAMLLVLLIALSVSVAMARHSRTVRDRERRARRLAMRRRPTSPPGSGAAAAMAHRPAGFIVDLPRDPLEVRAIRDYRDLEAWLARTPGQRGPATGPPWRPDPLDAMPQDGPPGYAGPDV